MNQEKYSNINDDDLSELGSSTVVDFEEKSKTVAESPKTYPEAWLALFLLVLLRAAISVFQFTYSAVPTITSEFFHVSLSAVNWLANIQTLIYVLVSFFTGWIFQRVGVKRSVSFSLLYRIQLNNISAYFGRCF
jgi:MFS family permease